VLEGTRRKAWSRISLPLFQFLERWLEGLSHAEVWRILIISVSVIAIADYLTQANIHFGPLYVLPICFASCRLTPRLALFLAVMMAALTVGTNFIILSDVPSLGMVANELVLYITAFAALVSVFCFVQYRFERKSAFTRRDGMTGALIRSVFRQQASVMMTAAAIQERALLLAYLDLDGFKSINDRYGHEAGDRVLEGFGAEGRAMLRSEDCFGRVGGDEFAVLMPLVSSKAGRKLAETLHERFTAALATTGYDVTCSMGALIILPDDAPTLDDVMRRVDRLMYAVKRDGKNSFRLATSALSPEQELPLFAGLMPADDPVCASPA